MSFPSKVLTSTEKAEIILANEKLRVITTKLMSYKKEITENADEIYVKFRRSATRNPQLLNDLLVLYEDIVAIKTSIDNTIKINNQHRTVDLLKKEIEEKKLMSSWMLCFTQIHEKLINVQDYRKNGNNLQAVMELKRTESLFRELPKDELNDVLNTDFKMRKLLICCSISYDLETLLVLTEGMTDVLQTIVLKVSKSQEFRQMLKCLKMLGVLPVRLEEFFSCICKPIICNVTDVRVHEDKDFNIFTVSINTTQLHSSYKEVFVKLLDVLSFVRLHLDFETSSDCTTITHLGNKFKTNFAEELMKNCLSSTLSGNDKEDKQVLVDVKDFETKLVDFGFLQRNNNLILKYVDNMNRLLANKHCDEYSERAILIMKKDLDDMVEVGVHFHLATLLTEDQFPHWYVSKSCVELLNLGKEILQQALLESDFFAIRLIHNMQGFFNQYGSIVYEHHAKLIQNTPQQVVLFRNNCMYLAHELTQLNKSYNKKFSRDVLTVPLIFQDQPHQLRTIGGNTFSEYIETQIKTMKHTLLRSKFKSNQLSKVMCPDANECIRQCLCQYELLRTVWHKILPHPVYNKTLGHLLNKFCERIIDVVTNAPDILVANAEKLTEMFKIVLARGPKLFTDPDKVNVYVELWQKLNELVFILGANLDEITERWVHSLLSMQLTADEVKHLIKALFQKTDHRAQALSLIV